MYWCCRYCKVKTEFAIQTLFLEIGINEDSQHSTRSKNQSTKTKISSQCFTKNLTEQPTNGRVDLEIVNVTVNIQDFCKAERIGQEAILRLKKTTSGAADDWWRAIFGSRKWRVLELSRFGRRKSRWQCRLRRFRKKNYRRSSFQPSNIRFFASNSQYITVSAWKINVNSKFSCFRIIFFSRAFSSIYWKIFSEIALSSSTGRSEWLLQEFTRRWLAHEYWCGAGDFPLSQLFLVFFSEDYYFLLSVKKGDFREIWEDRRTRN